MRRPSSIWRWRELLPVEDYSKIVTLGEGGTSLLECPRLAADIGVRMLYVKTDGLGNPTGSLKDRSVAVAATKALEFGYRVMACDSSGNKAASVAAYAARAGLKSVVFCPASTPKAKLAQAAYYGAKVFRVDGDYTTVNSIYRRLVHESSLGWYDSGTDNPFRYEGKKSYAYEIWDQLGQKAPDRILHPANGGMSTAKDWKGWKELKELGLVDRLPRMAIVQADTFSPIVQSFRRNDARVVPVPGGKTYASALAGRDPGGLGDLAMAALRESEGTAVAVSDSEILSSMRVLASEGIFSEPSGSVTIEGLRKLVRSGEIGHDETVVCVMTGVGFKDLDLIIDLVEIPDVIEGTVEALEKAAAGI